MLITRVRVINFELSQPIQCINVTDERTTTDTNTALALCAFRGKEIDQYLTGIRQKSVAKSSQLATTIAPQRRRGRSIPEFPTSTSFALAHSSE